MIRMPYNLVIEATDDPKFFCFYSPDLHGFTGVGNSAEDCIYKARHGMAEHVAILHELDKPIPPRPDHPTILIHDTEPAAQ